MTNELLQAAIAAVRRSSGPMTVSQIRTAVSRETRIPKKDRFPAEIRASLPGMDGIHVWPEFQRSPVFCSRPLAACVEEALLRALEQEPLTAAKAGTAVKKALRCVSETRILKEVKVLLGQKTASGTVVRLAAGRQSGIYLARPWMAKQAGTDGGELPLRQAIPGAVARLQSGHGNYVRVDQLRVAPEIRAIFDKAVIELADRRELVLAHFDGPYPVSEERKPAYVEDCKGELYVGVALPRD